MIDALLYRDWIEKSERDIKSAKTLKENNCGNDIVAFHCQQAVERLLKLYLIAKGEKIDIGRNLIYLCKLSEKHNGEFKKYIKDCGFLNQYYLETRYAVDSPLMISDYETKECIEIAEKIYINVAERI